MTRSRTCVVMPGYNAAATLGPLVRGVVDLGLDAIVVDDGSTDQTVKVATEHGAFVISHIHNRGKGSALRTGFAYVFQSDYETIITMDCDGQHDPQDIPALLNALQTPTVDIALGQRGVDGSVMPFARRCVNQVMSHIVSWLTKQHIPDSQCGFRAIRRRVLDAVKLSACHFEIESELLLTAASKGCKVVSVPVRTIYDNHASHIRPFMDGLRFARLVVRHLLSRFPGAGKH